MINWKDFTNLRVFRSIRLKKTAAITTENNDGTTTEVGVDKLAGIDTQAVPQVATGTATLTGDQMLGGLLVATPTSAAAYTVLTGALLAAAKLAVSPKLSVGDTITLVIINLGGTGDDITLTAASGITIVGDPVVGPIADVATEQMSNGTFLFRYSAADTFVAYRIA